MASYQFPPSSPLAHGDLNEGDSYDAFKKPSKGLTDDIRGRYPTPNPSSTTGRSSSPTRYEEEKENDVFGAKPAARQVRLLAGPPALSMNTEYDLQTASITQYDLE
ncbi:hypothetical protein QCA50_012933 [Cerrena zonata]|uniref:Uncharacterized protein n=1 Tax=Cerrena zonata TaxID=2478898 RepID=A0AAW0FXD4_9APHY